MKRARLAMMVLTLVFVMALPAMVMARPLDEVTHRTENGTVFVPLRLTAYAHGAGVEWDAENHLVIITHPNGDIWTIIYVEAVGGFIEYGTSWVPYEYAAIVFAGEEAVLEGPGARPQIHGAIHRVEYGNNVAYLFGTIHGGHEHWFPLANVVEDALRRSDVLAVEIDEVADEEALLAALVQVMFLPDGQTWVDFLPEYAYNHLVAMMEAWEVPYEEVNTFNPAYLTFQLTMQLANALADFEVGIGMSVDAYVAAIAAERGMQIIGLESIEQQMNILYNPPFEVMVAQVMDLLPPDELAEALMAGDEMGLDQMAYHYENNNLRALVDGWAATNNIEIDHPVVTYMRETLFNWRSTYYADRIAELLRETEEPTTFFVAVGLSHIIRSWGGEEFTDIVQQLRLQGFDVVAIFDVAAILE